MLHLKKPPPPTGNSPLAVWLRTLCAYVETHVCRGVIGGRLISHPEGGYTIQIPPAVASASGALTVYRVKSVPANEEYLVCRTWDGENEGQSDVKVAKSFTSRQPVSETLAGTVWGYSYSAGPDSLNQYRTATSAGGVTERQVVIPLWTADGLIAVTTINHSGVTVDDQELMHIESSARCWARTDV